MEFKTDDQYGLKPIPQDLSGLQTEKRWTLQIGSVFGLSSGLNQSAWERKRDRVVARINAKIAAGS
jgi:hypothetical protein